jgi:hypothetical protein
MADQEMVQRITAEVAASLKLTEEQRLMASRYAKRAVNKILLFCNREDFPEMLEDTAAQMTEDMLTAELIVSSEKEVSSITRGDTSIAYRDGHNRQKQAIDFMKNYEAALVKFKKLKLPKDEERTGWRE